MSETRDERGLADEQARYVVVELSLNVTAEQVWAEKEAGRRHPESTPVGPFLTREAADQWAYAECCHFGGGSWALGVLAEPCNRPDKARQSAIEAPSGDEQAEEAPGAVRVAGRASDRSLARRMRARRAAQRLRDEVAAANPNGLVFHEDDESLSGAREGVTEADRDRMRCHRDGDTCAWAGCPNQFDDRPSTGCFLVGARKDDA